MQINSLLMSWIYLVEAIVYMFTGEKSDSLMEEEGEEIIRIAMLDDKAYWVHDNIFYEADLIDGDPDIDNARPIDAINISDVEIDKLLYILDTLNDE